MAEAIQPPERPRPESGSGEDEARRVAESSSLLVRWMSIGDANSGGFIHGGTVMRLVDEAAGLAAIKHSGRRVVTAGMDRMTFNTPVFVGELLRCTASVNAVWRSSMEVGVRVEADHGAAAGRLRALHAMRLGLRHGGSYPAPRAAGA